MMDELKTKNVSSFSYFGASVRSRKIKAPAKKSIRKTVPFSSQIYDFSKIDGEIYYGEQELEYVLEMSADSAEKLEKKKMPLKNWLMNIFEENLYDPFTEEYHYKATYSSHKFDDSEDGEYTALTVVFKAYPYMISNTAKEFSFNLNSLEQKFYIENDSSHRVYASVSTKVPVEITIGTSKYSVTGIHEKVLPLNVGNNELKVKATAGNGTLKVSFHEEVF